ncbi:hypothetical protein Tco_1553807 [Tanacetum coccineum]
MSSFTVTYTSISSDSDLPPWGFHLMDPTKFEAPKEAPQPPKQASPSPNYVPGPEHPPSPDYVLGPGYPEYVADSDPEEDPEEDLADYPTDGGDDEEEEEDSS